MNSDHPHPHQLPFSALLLSAPSPSLGPAYVPTPPSGAARTFGGSAGGDDGARRLSSSSSLAPKLSQQQRGSSSSRRSISPSVLADPAALLELEAQARAPLDPSLSPLFAVDGATRLGVSVFEGAERRSKNSSSSISILTTSTSSTLPLLPLAPHPAAEDAPPWLERLLWPPPPPPSHDNKANGNGILFSKLPPPP